MFSAVAGAWEPESTRLSGSWVMACVPTADPGGPTAEETAPAKCGATKEVAVVGGTSRLGPAAFPEEPEATAASFRGDFSGGGLMLASSEEPTASPEGPVARSDIEAIRLITC